MSEVYFIGDLHFGHKGILKFAKGYRCTDSMEEHDKWIVRQWNSVVKSNDTVFVVGDICFDRNKLGLVKQMRGNKHLILGNHDNFNNRDYSKYFNKVTGPIKYKKYWVTHIPIHPNELWGCKNIHGHVHMNSIDDNNYINVSVETCRALPINFNNIKNGMHQQAYQMINNFKNI